jgi:hypothetical protein
MPRVQALKSAHRVAVVSELPVVVVLQYHASGPTCPVDDLRATLGAQFDTRRVLMRWGQQHGTDIAHLREIRCAGAVLVDFQDLDPQSCFQQQCPIRRKSVRLHRNGADAPNLERLSYER